MSIYLVVAASLGAGFVIRLLRRWQRPVFFVTLLSGLVLALLLATASSEPVDLLGRVVRLDLTARLFLFPALVITSVLALSATLTFDDSPQSAQRIILNSQGAFFFISYGALVVAVTLDSFPLAAFAWVIALIVQMFLAMPQREEGVGGAAQFLLLAAIATASLLISNRFLELYPLTPENFALVRSAVLFLAWGLALLLALAPLHVWLAAVTDELPLLGTAFFVGIAQPVGLWLLYDRMSHLPWLAERSVLLPALVTAGVFTAAVGALLALGEKRDARWLAYLGLVPLGQALIGFGHGTALALTGALFVLMSRALGIALVAGGLTFVRTRDERAWKRIGAFAVGLGGLVLAGIPPTLGAIAPFTIYHEISADVPVLALLFVSNALVLITTLNAAWQLYAQSESGIESANMARLVPLASALSLGALFLGGTILGVFPQLAAEMIMAAMGGAAYLR